MKKINKSKKAVRYRLARVRYAAKRHTLKWKNRKKNKRNVILQKKQKRQKQKRKPYEILSAPKSFSLIENTDDVLKYFNNAEKKLKNGNNVTLDISNVTILTPATLLLMIASINDADFVHDSLISGNAPKDDNLRQLFTESGFYDYVKARRAFVRSEGNLLHKEVNHVVASDIAKKASLTGIRYVFKNETPFEPLYEILVECMSNTNNHANLHLRGKCNWWLYVYNEPNKNITSYSFLDLGVGIFKSVVVQNYLKNLLKGVSLYKNINLVDDLLSGKLQSRIDETDKDIRGQGIPQIVEHANSDHFKSFYIIANDVKINLKTGDKKQLKYKLNGTFLHWELQE